MLRTAAIQIRGGGQSKTPRRVFDPEWWRTAAGSFVLVLSLWVERARTRRILLELDEHLLRDIGRTSIEAQRESARPFWRP
jgi:uncharacterized protein YjiS (DUF1127 family)